MSLKKLFLPIICFICINSAFAGSSLHLYKHPTPYLSDASLPPRTPPIKIGDPMLGPGKISRGTFNPRLWIYGLIRTTAQAFRTGISRDSSEWANRIDLFANLQLTGTERFLLHIRPLNKNSQYTSYVFTPNDCDGYRDEFNVRITQLFFEGDLGEMFSYGPARSGGPRDVGFAIGRQQIFFQDGIFIDDFIDGIAITQNSIAFQSVNNLQLAAYVGVNNIDRDDNRADRDALLFGIHSRADLTKRTIDFDAAYVNSQSCHHNNADNKGDLLAGAISSVQIIGRFGVTFHLLGSVATTHRSEQSSDGVLVFIESNREYGLHHDFLYLNAAAAFGEFTSVARDPTVGGPLGRLGILFAAAGIGDLGSALNNRANCCVAGALGYQKFFNFNWQGILELGARVNTDTSVGDSVALGARLQRGIGERCVLRFDAFGGARNRLHPMYALRMELLIKV